ncbi:MAG: CHAD domain-containing protein, partial [Betaproteobacteria bacterium]
DAGVILAAERRLPVCELEIELLSGSASAVIDAARRWVAQHGVWLDTRSKAERGDLLSRGETVAAVRKAQPVALSDDMPAPRAMRRVLASCCEQISVNASQVASGEYLAEHVHQLRVGLRRLRTALRLFKGIADTAALDDAATSLFRRLGGARDEAAVGRPLEEALGRALADVGLSLPTPHWQPPPDEQGAPPADASVRDAATQTLLLDLLACTREPDPPPTASDPEPAARELIERRLKRWHRQVVADAKRFAELDDAGRHALRRRAKRLRYALEFANDLYEPSVVKRYQKRLRQTLERLGEVIDVMVGLQGYRALADSEPGVLFALGWLAQRRDRLVAQCEPELKAFVRVKPFWKG